MLKIHHDFRGTIRGATLVAANASELIGEVTLCMNHGVKLGALAGSISLPDRIGNLQARG